MPERQDAAARKCVGINLPVSLFRKAEAYRAKAGKSRNTAMAELIEKGLDSS